MPAASGDLSRAASSCSNAVSTNVEAPVRIERTGRGRFRLHIDRPLHLDAVEA